MAFHTIWSVDLGKSALKAVKLRRERNNVEILAIDKVDCPVSTNGMDASSDARKEVLSVFRSRNEVREPVVVSHPGQGTFSRFIKVPAFDDKKVHDMVQYEASQQIPFPLDEVIWDSGVMIATHWLQGRPLDGSSAGSNSIGRYDEQGNWNLRGQTHRVPVRWRSPTLLWRGGR